MKFTVILVAKHSPESHTIYVDANDGEDAMEKVNTMIETDPNYSEFKHGWRISEAV